MLLFWSLLKIEGNNVNQSIFILAGTKLIDYKIFYSIPVRNYTYPHGFEFFSRSPPLTATFVY